MPTNVQTSWSAVGCWISQQHQAWGCGYALQQTWFCLFALGFTRYHSRSTYSSSMSSRCVLAANTGVLDVFSYPRCVTNRQSPLPAHLAHLAHAACAIQYATHGTTYMHGTRHAWHAWHAAHSTPYNHPITRNIVCLQSTSKIITSIIVSVSTGTSTGSAETSAGTAAPDTTGSRNGAGSQAVGCVVSCVFCMSLCPSKAKGDAARG